jgi:hypothetical protein
MIVALCILATRLLDEISTVGLDKLSESWLAKLTVPLLDLYSTKGHTGIPCFTMLMPFARDEDFVGRADVIEMIDEKFSKSKFFRRVALTGLGGVGCAMADPEISRVSDSKQKIPNSD